MSSILEHVRYRIAQIVRRPGRAPLFSIETVLLMLAIVYGAVMRLRAALYHTGVLSSKRLPCRVVSIGNITAGGTGKTPMTIMVANSLKSLGLRVVVISRGYRGKMEHTGGIVSDGQTIFEGPEAAGDEPFMMARLLKGIPVLVGRSRYEVGMLAVERFRPDVILLDDAFQHLHLQRDVDIVLLDSQAPYGNGYVLPRGLLREPISALGRADAIVFTRCRPAQVPPFSEIPTKSKPIFYTEHVLSLKVTAEDDAGFIRQSTEMASLEGKKVVAFAGLADNHQFFDSLTRLGCNLVKTFAFTDHHRYSCGDLKLIAQTAEKEAVDLLVTTFKDFVKVDNWVPPIGMVAIDLNIRFFENDHVFRDLIAGLQQTEKA